MPNYYSLQSTFIHYHNFNPTRPRELQGNGKAVHFVSSKRPHMFITGEPTELLVTGKVFRFIDRSVFHILTPF